MRYGGIYRHLYSTQFAGNWQKNKEAEYVRFYSLERGLQVIHFRKMERLSRLKREQVIPWSTFAPAFRSELEQVIRHSHHSSSKTSASNSAVTRLLLRLDFRPLVLTSKQLLLQSINKHTSPNKRSLCYDTDLGSF